MYFIQILNIHLLRETDCLVINAWVSAKSKSINRVFRH